jgi:hypothetical protein
MTGRPPHEPRLPPWDCRICATPWPCPTRRAELSRQYAGAPASLYAYLASCFIEASMGDLRYKQVGPLYDQFLGWLAVGRRRRLGP